MAISYDSESDLAAFAKLAKIEFPLLSDPDSKAIDAFGVPNKEASGRMSGIPHPITVIVDQEGIVRGKLQLPGYRDRHTTEALLTELAKLKD